ncbi:hypothetical protein ODZ84_04260 [Chryseobacterium fluminis]|uniref:hypothetical protein n=1 Tax=Chryseobacterium fluminis TaxID=2983606 RepID=UPI002254D703|nr:hypothetical protein [Chryseobacterium sp. MMS21-Ot14]UZT98792.1 hypothetical protein ODZ84_04260 [Chryseobacterium sp. MMS21-Ot14]
MKNRLLLLNIISIFLSLSCFNQSNLDNDKILSTSILKKEKIEKVQLSEQTRGINEEVILTSTSITAISNGDVSEWPISSTYWGNVSREAEAIDLSQIKNLQSPTTDRYSDQAISVTITIICDGSAFTSASFDIGQPPKELKRLYEAIKGNSVKIKKSNFKS